MDTALLHCLASQVASTTAPVTVIYVAIGCAQGHYAEGKHSAQQYPPFLSGWNPPGAEKHVILIDPALEDPPRSLVDLATGAIEEPADIRNITFYPIREPFYWEEPTHRAFLTGLVRIVLATPPEIQPTYLIVQDYSGASLQDKYMELLEDDFRYAATTLLERVLFDPAYDGPGCFQDLTTPVLRHPVTGVFLQPAYIPLAQLMSAHPTPPPTILRKQQETRSALIRYYAARLLRTELSAAAAEDALERLRPFAPIVGYMPTADPSILRRLISETLRDFGAVASPPRTYTDAQIAALLSDTRGSALNLEFHALTH
jgi:hypothetical protein